MHHTQAESPPSSSDQQRPTSSTSEGGRENLEPTHQAREGQAQRREPDHLLRSLLASDAHKTFTEAPLAFLVKRNVAYGLPARRITHFIQLCRNFMTSRPCKYWNNI